MFPGDFVRIAAPASQMDVEREKCGRKHFVETGRSPSWGKKLRAFDICPKRTELVNSCNKIWIAVNVAISKSDIFCVIGSKIEMMSA